MKNFKIALLALTLISISSPKLTDEDPITLPQREDNLEKELLEFQKEALKLLEEDQKKTSAEALSQLKFLQQTTKFSCTGGEDPYYMSKKDYLVAFAKGPCAPVVMVPGILGSKLVAKIDCETLRNDDPYTFSACGWTGCGFLSSKPKAEYRIWIPGLTDPTSLIKPYGSSKRCFAGIIGNYFTGDGDNIKVVPKTGVSIDTLGSTEYLGNQKKDYRCGFDAIEKLLPLIGNYAGTLNYKYIDEAFINAGYIEGLTAQAMPYDFRLEVRDNLLNKKYSKVVNELFEITGKKVVLIAHSFGNFQTMNFLWNYSQADKDKKIARYFALAPPLGGAVKPVASFIGMDSTYSKGLLIAKVGLTTDFFDIAADTFQGMFNLFPQGHFSKKRSEKFVQLMLQKIEAEKNKRDPPKGSIWDIFPHYNAQCVEFFKDMPDNCDLGLSDMSEFGRVQQNKLTFENMENILKKYSYSEYSAPVYKKSVDSRFTDLLNPGVQVNVVFGTTGFTNSEIIYEQDPKTKTTKGSIYDPDTVKDGRGDGSVLTSSALIGPIKWGEEFRTGVQNAKPVTFIHMCSSYNKRKSIFENGAVTKNMYMGVDCSCKGSSTSRVDGSPCAGHANMLEEPGLVNLLLDGVMDGQKGYIGARFMSMNDAALNNYVESCRMFNEL